LVFPDDDFGVADSRNFHRNVSNKFDEIVHSIQRSDSQVVTATPEMKDVQYCLVGGLWSNLAPLWFRTAMVRFSELGLQSEQAVIDTSAGIMSNANLLKQAIPMLRSKHGKKLVLIGHSKGTITAFTRSKSSAKSNPDRFCFVQAESIHYLAY
jgi:hypothetical protein